MEKYIVDERNGLEYELVGDYYIVAGEDEPPARPIGVSSAPSLTFPAGVRRSAIRSLQTRSVIALSTTRIRS